MNVYIASFMLLLFNAVGVHTPAAAVATETADNQDVSLTETAASLDWDGVERALMQTSSPAAPVRIASTDSTRPIWPVLPVAETIGDKLEHEEGAP